MKWYFKITRGYTAWYVGKGAYNFADVKNNLFVALFTFLWAMYKVWRHKPVNVLKYQYKYRGGYSCRTAQPPADMESVRAAAVEINQPAPVPIPVGIISRHFGNPEPELKDVIDLKFTPRPGVEYFECPECRSNTLCFVGASPGYRESTEYYECENPDCLHTTSFP